MSETLSDLNVLILMNSMRLAELREVIRPLIERENELERDRRKLRSRAFLLENNLTLADVEMSSGDDRPWFGDVETFAEWLRSHSVKQWAEWNGMIFRTSDLVAGNMPEAPERVEDLPKGGVK